MNVAVIWRRTANIATSWGLVKSPKLIVLFAAIWSLGMAALPLRAEVAEYSVYVVDPPINNRPILPGVPLPPVCKPDKTLDVRACPGEYEPASFVVVANRPMESVRIEVDALSGPAGTLPREAVDVRIARPWNMGDPVQDLLPPPMVLLKDDSMLASEPDPSPEYPQRKKNVAPHGLRDSEEFLPLRIEDLRQFWLTVHVPASARPGPYSAALRIIPENAPSSELVLRLEVYPFRLAAPIMEYSIYYPVSLVPEGSDDWRSGKWTNTAWLTPEQYTLECKNMLAHGLTNPNIYTGVGKRPDGSLDFSNIEEVLAVREKAGMGPSLPLYMMSNAAEPVARPLTEEEKNERVRDVREVMAWGKRRGYTDIYWAAIDEAGGSMLSAERGSFQAIHDGGGKVFVACSSDFYDLVGDLLDLPVLVAHVTDYRQGLIESLSLTHPNKIPLDHQAERAEVKAQLLDWDHQEDLVTDDFAQMRGPHYRGLIDGTHRRGNCIYTYMFPGSFLTMPEVHRRSHGLGLWQMGFDGSMNWAYAHIRGDIGPDPIGQGFWGYVIRTKEGVLDKLQWEGFREGVDDIRYLSTLLDALGRAAGTFGKEPLVAETWTWLTGLDAARDDLNAIRAEMARRTIALKDLGERRKPLVEIDPGKLGVAPVDEEWDVEFTGDGLPTNQGWKGDANSSQFATDIPPGFLLAVGNPGGGFNKVLAGYTKAHGWTLEWALKAINLHQLPSAQDVVAFNDDTSVLSIRYARDSVTLKDHLKDTGASVALNLEDYHIYRLVRQPGSATVELYIDNHPKAALSITPAALAPPFADAGNLDSVGWGNSLFQARWDFFRYHSGATVPTAGPTDEAQTVSP